MNRKPQPAMIANAMWNDTVTDSFTAADWRSIMTPLQLLLARLIDPQNKDEFIFGAMGRPEESRMRTLLVTKSSIYYADFRLRLTPGDEPGWVLDGDYNLRIVPFNQITGITIHDIGTTGSGMTDEVLRTDYTIHTPEFPISIPLDQAGRIVHLELEFLDLLHSRLN